ncbi:15844_t:CDS:2, partial [Acaulospora colombiana]
TSKFQGAGASEVGFRVFPLEKRRLIPENRTVKRTSALESPIVALTVVVVFRVEVIKVAAALWRTYAPSNNYGQLPNLHKTAITDLQWSSISPILYTVSADKTIAMSDLTTGERVKRLRGHSGIINAISTTTAGGSGIELLATAADDGTVKVWEGGDEGSKHCVADWQLGCPVTAVCWGPDGNSVYIGALDNLIHVYDLRKGEEVTILGGHTDTPTSIALSPDGGYLLTSTLSVNEQIRVIYHVTISLFTNNYSRHSTFQPITNQNTSHTLRYAISLDLESKSFTSITGAPAGFENALIRGAWSRTDNGSRVAVGGADRTVTIWDVETTKIQYKLPGHKGTSSPVAKTPRFYWENLKRLPSSYTNIMNSTGVLIQRPTVTSHMASKLLPHSKLAFRPCQTSGVQRALLGNSSNLVRMSHLPRQRIHRSPITPVQQRWVNTGGLTNLFDTSTVGGIQVRNISEIGGIELEDGLTLRSSCILTRGKVFLWKTPGTPWNGWSAADFELFEVLVPKPEILLIGTGKSLLQPPPSIRQYLHQIGVQFEIMDTVRIRCYWMHALIILYLLTNSRYRETPVRPLTFYQRREDKSPLLYYPFLLTPGRDTVDWFLLPKRPQEQHRGVQSSDSEVDLENDDDQIRNYAPTSPAQWSHHRHSVNSTVEGHIQAERGSLQRRGTQAARRSPIDSLPLEMLIHIFRQLTETSHLYNCLFVSSTWCQCVVELLWLKPHLASLDSLLAFLRIIQPGFNPNAPESNGEITFDSREVLVNGRWQSRESVGKETQKTEDPQGKSEATAQIEPYFPYARFVRRLNLSGVADDIQDIYFRCLTACTRLERLTLNGCIHLTDNSLSILGNMPNLVALDLTGVVDVTDATIVSVANVCNKIQGINLEGCKKVTDIGLLAIAENCPLLRRIKLCELDRITGNSVSKLVHQCPLLIEIDLNGCIQIDEGAVRDIWTHCSHLRELRLAQCSNIGDFAFPAAPRLAKPASTGNTGNGPSNTTPIVLPLLPPLLLSRPLGHLRQLDLMSVHITDEAVSGIIANAPRLRNLVLAKCSNLTDTAVRSISELGRHLQFLHLGHAAAITDSCISLTDDSVKALAALPKLRRIGLVRVPNLTDDAVRYLTARGSTLERVHLSYCERITVRAIYVLLKRLTKLTHLSLTGVPAFRRSELQQFCRPPPSNFNDTQRAAFCVYSGPGIHHLRKYLEKIAHSVQREGQPEEDDGGGVFSSLADNLVYETDEDVQELDEHDFLSNMPHLGPNRNHQAQSDGIDRNPSMSQYQSGTTRLPSSVGNTSSSTYEQSHTSTGSPLH